MLHWFKKNFEQFQGSSWYYEGKNDEKIYESSIEHINEQMKLEKKDKLKHTIEQLGFSQEKDYNGKLVLKNKVPIKKTMTFQEVEGLVNRLNKAKYSKKKAPLHSKDPSKQASTGIKQLTY